MVFASRLYTSMVWKIDAERLDCNSLHRILPISHRWRMLVQYIGEHQAIYLYLEMIPQSAAFQQLEGVEMKVLSLAVQYSFQQGVNRMDMIANPAKSKANPMIQAVCRSGSLIALPAFGFTISSMTDWISIFSISLLKLGETHLFFRYFYQVFL